jgi:hypothetical protein
MGALTTIAVLAGSFLVLRSLFSVFSPGHFTEARSVMAIGDSLTASGGYCSTLKSLLPEGSTVNCIGLAGEGVENVYDLVSHVKEGTTDVVVLAGVNDLASGRTPEEVLAGLRRIYADAQDYGVRVVAVTLTPWTGHVRGGKKRQETNDVNQMIKRADIPSVVVDTSPLGDQVGFLRQEYNSGDGLHLNNEGQKQLGYLIWDQAF